MDNSELFPRDHIKTCYLGKNVNGYIDSSEFGDPLGKISHTDRLIQVLVKNYVDKGGTINFGESVSSVSKSIEKVEVKTNKGNTYVAKLLVLATGSRGFEIQSSLGFEIPDSYMGIYCHMFESESQIESNFDFDYLFHINPNISENGPFFFNVGKGRVCTGYLGNKGESGSELVNKLDRILRNYKYIQPNLEGLKWDKSKFITGKISKHPISRFSQDRTLILGEAAGLVTAFFYEGLLSGLISAELASETINPLLDKESSFSHTELANYDKELKYKLLNKYYKNGEACEFIFYDASPSAINKIWDTYTKLIQENKKLRKQIWEAYRKHDIENYDLSRDKWAGERLFEKLPALSKLSLGPKFLKALIKF
ncbi:MAG: hypothetical protein GF317_08905 [Candidatus Lokiarchaeota archaeon]|nr:hypothetical protein [Candidatus Lokiarchaeota archaeon]MBD3199830.1 hypothetical protein [Candidatus Lokiarchaeota archaeon]